MQNIIKAFRNKTIGKAGISYPYKVKMLFMNLYHRTGCWCLTRKDNFDILYIFSMKLTLKYFLFWGENSQG